MAKKKTKMKPENGSSSSHQHGEHHGAAGGEGHFVTIHGHPVFIKGPPQPGAHGGGIREQIENAKKRSAAIQGRYDRMGVHGINDQGQLAQGRKTFADQIRAQRKAGVPAIGGPLQKKAAAPKANPAAPSLRERAKAAGRGTEDRLDRAASLRVERARLRGGNDISQPGFEQTGLDRIRQHLGGDKARQDRILYRARKAGTHYAEPAEGLAARDAAVKARVHNASATLEDSVGRYHYLGRRETAPVIPARGTGKGKRISRKRS